jgi:uncharacterized protein (DUF1499 family)
MLESGIRVRKRMSWLDGFTKNWADLTDGNADPALRAVVVPLPPAEALSWAAARIRSLPRWAVVATDQTAGTLHATHETLLWRFVDDVRLEFHLDGAGGTIITGRSRSRIGRGDLGQNARNLRELTTALRAEAPGSGFPA